MPKKLLPSEEFSALFTIFLFSLRKEKELHADARKRAKQEIKDLREAMLDLENYNRRLLALVDEQQHSVNMLKTEQKKKCIPYD